MRPQLSLALATLLLSLAAVAGGCQSGGAAASAAPGATSGVTLDAASTDPIEASTAVLVVHGLGCPLCAHNVDGQLAALAGVRDVEVDLGTGAITVALAGEKRPSPAQLATAVDSSGFTLVRIFTP